APAVRARYPAKRGAAYRALHAFPARRSSDLSFGGGSFDSGRRSVPDVEERTIAEHAIDIEELQPNDIQSWQTGDRTVMATNQKRSEEHTSELQSPYDLVCRLLLEKKKDHTL